MSEMAITRWADSNGYSGANGVITRIVLHDEEYPVSGSSAEIIAGWFADPLAHSSAHYVVDADSIQHCVPDNVLAYHAPPNHGSIGIEHDGYARFTAADWDTAGSRATLARSAVLCAQLCQRYAIPVVFLTAADLVRNPYAKGITFHSQVTLAFGQSSHMDPGTAFPLTTYLAAVSAALAPAPAVPPLPVPVPAPPSPLGEDPMIVIHSPNHPAAFLAPDGVAHVMGSDRWSAINHLNAINPALVEIVLVSDTDWVSFVGNPPA